AGEAPSAYREKVAKLCFDHALTCGDVSLCPYDVTTLLCRRRREQGITTALSMLIAECGDLSLVVVLDDRLQVTLDRGATGRLGPQIGQHPRSPALGDPT